MYGQRKWDARFSLGIGPSLTYFALNENPYLFDRTTVLVSDAKGYHQRLGLHIGEKQNKAFLALGLQHNVNKIKVDYLKFDNPLIKEGQAHQVFDLRYFSMPMGIGRRIKTGQKSELRVSLFSEILATYRLRCVDSSIAIEFTDNTNDNLATITSNYGRYGRVYWDNLGTGLDFSLSMKRNVHLLFSAGAVWQPRRTSWIYIGAEMFAGGQHETIYIYSALFRYTFSLGLSLDI
ncbi:MAG: hypothetical protein EBV15_03545 [Bacteroidetes bacterium]|nr:hypothetical protein [Bacteroidota bacterium]